MQFPLPVAILIFAYSVTYLSLLQLPGVSPAHKKFVLSAALLFLFLVLEWPFLSWQALFGYLSIWLWLLVWKFATEWMEPAQTPRQFFLTQSLPLAMLVWMSRVAFVRPTTNLPDYWLLKSLDWLGWSQNLLALILLHASAILWLLWGSTSLVRGILQPHTKQLEQIGGDELQRGKTIGNLERLLIYLFIQFGQPGLITLVVGLKALARFKKLEERHFAEYFLIGTLASLLFAVLISFLMREVTR